MSDRARRDLLVDAAAAVALYGLLLATTRGVPTGGTAQPDGLWPIVLAAGVTLPLAARRRAPLAVLVAVTAAVGGFQALQPLNLVVPLGAVAFATYSAGVYGSPGARDVVRGGCAIALAAMLAWMVATMDVDAQAWPPRLALYTMLFAAGWVAGEQTRRANERETELAARTKELEAERVRSRLQAVTEERLRIARELHDVLGHHVSVMGVQAAGAARILDRDPTRALEALDAIELSSRRAVSEMQRVLALLRTDDDAHRPTLANLHEFVDGLHAAGVEISVALPDELDVPASIDLAATRVVQEALTNVVRHAGAGTSVRIEVTESIDTLALTIVDDGAGNATQVPAGRNGGRGLVGLRERVELHGGAFVAEPRRGGGFRVAATLPLHNG